MPRFVADESFSYAVTRQLRQRGVDVVTVQEIGLARMSDPALLEWAADARRVLITNDVSTMIGHAYQRIRVGLPMTGLIVARQSLPLGVVVEDVHILAECTGDEEWENRVEHLPLR